MVSRYDLAWQSRCPITGTAGFLAAKGTMVSVLAYCFSNKLIGLHFLVSVSLCFG
jgi:hypothetical protein